MISNLFLPGLGKIGEKTAGSSAQIRIARCALAIEQYRLQNQGSIPSGLRELVPAFLNHVPKDPFKGQLLSYKPGLSNYVLYSAGTDGVNDESDLKGQFAMRVDWFD